MADKKVDFMSDIVPITSKITNHKLNGFNFLDWNHTIELYLLRLSMDRHLTDDPPTDDSRLPWMREDARLYIQIRNSIESEVVGLVNHCKTVKQLMSYLQFLYSGKGNFSRIYDVFLSGSEISSLDDVFRRVRRTENSLPTSSPQHGSVLLSRALPSDSGKQHFKSSGPGRSMGSGSTKSDPQFGVRGLDHSAIICHYCHKPGHTKRDCRKLQFKKTSSAHVASSVDTSSSAITISADEYVKLLHLQDTIKHPSGPVSALVESADGSTSSVIGSGTSYPTPSLTLSSDLLTKKIIGKGHESDGLYILDTHAPEPVACTGIVSPFEEHCRLGHPSLPSLKKLCPQFSSLKSLDCESCQFAKHHRLSSSPRFNNRASAPFELVHSDVWGPSPVTSKPGFRYFVTFVDDYSRMTWLYLMKSRSELFTHFSSFCAEIRTQFGTPVRNLRSDNAKEYVSGPFQKYMLEHGILHQTSCVDTPSQNGVAERKNRHLLETARALLFQMQVPKCFWADAISTACFLINRMPSSVLLGNIPFQTLFPTKNLFPLSPKIFGCICFVRDVRSQVTILDPKSLRCVFLGYSRGQKGYRCYCPGLGRYLVSADVTFLEHKPFLFSSGSIAQEDEDFLFYQVPSPLELSSSSLVPPSFVKPPIKNIYTRRPQPPPSDPITNVPDVPDSCPDEPISSSSDSPCIADLDLPITLRKGDIFTKALNGIRINYLCNKLGMINIYDPT
ncbi:hypothetical protein HRI_001497700 [Hibiscus trionum]|uniref:Retrovirus-related Pol polyprotein from transposon TNT 1-94 n=1 Tax=Hibiscus trionum TaxID=183268 RepID=A0A9W7HIN0_HIBTR|nr:hypothetical protein HRI_001497700 [Hibiscus trionum]